MSPLIQFLVRAYLPLAARHTLIDGAVHVRRKPPAVPAAGGDAKPARVATLPRRPLRLDERKRAASLAA